MSAPFQTIGRGADLQSTKFRAGFGFMVDPDKNGTGTKVRIYHGWVQPGSDGLDGSWGIFSAPQTDFTLSDQDYVYVHVDTYYNPPV
jgi:hypothetical protein